MERDFQGWEVSASGAAQAVLVEQLRTSAQALRINFPGYTSEVRWTDRVLRFPALFDRNMMFREAIPGTPKPNPSLLYSLVTGDPGSSGYFPMNAVRWRTRPRDIAALVTKSSGDEFEAELYHFGAQARPMAADLYLLRTGRFRMEVF